MSVHVGLFIPCYIDQFYPNVGIATLELLEKTGCTVSYPLDQTCCGQPLGNAGDENAARKTMDAFVRKFDGPDYIVCPSGSCVHFVQHHYASLNQSDAVRRVRVRTMELCQFLTDVLKITDLGASFPHRVGLHASCHGLRGLRLGSATERNIPSFDKVKLLLNSVEGLSLVDLDRNDECCGFGGTFAVSEEAVSVRMGLDRLQDHTNNKAEVITGTDMSCMMHLEGLARRQKTPVVFRHVAEILNGTTI